MVLTGEGKDDSMTPRTLTPDVELVVVAADQAATLEPSVKRLHAHLRDAHAGRFPSSWRVTIADHASTDGTGPVADRLAAELFGVSTVHLPERLDRKALRASWRTSDASVAAFVTLAPDTDIEKALAPLVRHTAASSIARTSGMTVRDDTVRDDTARRPSGGGRRGARRLPRRVRWQRLVDEQRGDVGSRSDRWCLDDGGLDDGGLGFDLRHRECGNDGGHRGPDA